MSGEKKLTALQEKYCQLRAKGKSKSDAFRGSYSTKNMKPETVNNNAYKLEQKGEILTRIAELQAPVIKRTETDAQYALEAIRETMDRCRQISPVLDRQGNHVFVETADGMLVPAFTFDSAAVLKGADMLMKHFGQYELHNKQKTDNKLTLLLGKIPDGAMEKLMSKLYGIAGRQQVGGRVIEGAADRLPGGGKRAH